MAKLVRPEDFQGPHVDQRGPDRHRANIQKVFNVGIDTIYLHNVGRIQVGWPRCSVATSCRSSRAEPTVQKGDTCKHNRLTSTATAHG